VSTHVTSPKTESKGAIFVRPVSRKVEYQFKGVYIDPVKAQLIATVLQDPRRNLMLEGDQGVGKSTIAAAIARTLGWEYRKVSGGLIKKFVFMLGRYIPTSDSKTLNFRWADSKLSETLREAQKNPRRTYPAHDRRVQPYRRGCARRAAGHHRRQSARVALCPPARKSRSATMWSSWGRATSARASPCAAKTPPPRTAGPSSRSLVMPQEEELAHCLRLYPTCQRAPRWTEHSR
jgi:hypothetical protein